MRRVEGRVQALEKALKASMAPKNCLNCGIKFVPGIPNQDFCSKYCAEDYSERCGGPEGIRTLDHPVSQVLPMSFVQLRWLSDALTWLSYGPRAQT